MPFSRSPLTKLYPSETQAPTYTHRVSMLSANLLNGENQGKLDSGSWVQFRDKSTSQRDMQKLPHTHGCSHGTV